MPPTNSMSKYKEQIASSSRGKPRKKLFMAEEIPEKFIPGVPTSKHVFLPEEVNPGAKIPSHVSEIAHQAQPSSGTSLT